MIAVALRNSGSYTLWSGDGEPSEAWHLASTTEDFPKRSSLIRLTGVLVLSIINGVVTAEALSSIANCIRSLGSRTRKTMVSIIVLGSTLNEYCTVENSACPETWLRVPAHVARG